MLPRLSLLLTCLLLAGCPSPTPPAMTHLFPTDSRYRLEGRFDLTDPAQPVCIWAGSRVSIDFTGTELALQFGAASGQNFFNATVDGSTEVVAVPEGPDYRWVWPHALAEGRHHLEVLKRSEADVGHVVWRGIDLAPGAGTSAPALPAYRFRMEFLGDSITVGANNEDGAEDQWEDRRTHNHALSYGFLTSQALGADHRAMAVSGMGICEGYVDKTVGEIWDRVYPRKDSPRAELSAWVPDVVCLNFGENDASFTANNQRPFPAGFTTGYVALVRAVRAAYPAAQIVLLRGGMAGGAKSPELRTAWTAAVNELEASDPRISHYVFTHWTDHHPRVSDDRIMAGELTTWLQAQPFLQPFYETGR